MIAPMDYYFGGGIFPVSPPVIGGASSCVLSVPFEGEPNPNKAAIIK